MPRALRIRRAARWAALAGLAAALAALWALGGASLISGDALRGQWSAVADFAETRPAAAALVYMLTYVAATFLLLPGVLWLSIAAGAAFGAGPAAALTWVAAMIGANALFLAARTALGAAVARRARGWVALLRDGFRRDAFSYLLSLRLLPFAPYSMVNLAPALLDVPFRTFAAATAIGLVPGTILYALIGAGLSAALESGDGPLEAAARPEVLAGLVAAALLAIAPTVWRLLRSRFASRRDVG